MRLSILRVLFITMFEPFASTGPSSHLRGLSQALAKLGCEIHIMVLSKKPGNPILRDVQLHYINTSYASFSRLPILKVVLLPLVSVGKVIDRFCQVHKIDIIHSSCAGFGLDRTVDIPSITTCHGTDFGEFITLSKVPLSVMTPNLIIEIISTMLGVFGSHDKRAYGDKTIAVSKAIKNELVNFIGLSEEKIVPIHNGVDISSFTEFQKIKKTNEQAILSVGRFSWSKGHIFLIDAMPAVLSEYPNAKLWLVGEFLPTRARVPLQQHIKKLGIEKSVFFTGKVSTQRLNYLYHEAEVYVQPSLYEPFGITVLEAMSMRKPVIATNVGGIPEIIKNDREGLIVEPRNSLQLAEAISQMLSDPSRRRTIGNNARKRVEEEFTWEKNASKTLELYNHMI